MDILKIIVGSFICFSLLTMAAFAGAPNQISYQGRLTDSEGNAVPDGDYNITFQITEHSPMPMGESPLWSSGVQSVSVTDGLFVYYLGSNVPLPASIFTDDGLESHYLRFALEGSPVYSAGIKLASVPFAIRATSADTAAYAHSGPGSGSTGWVDDGSVVRLESYSDWVGIGTNSPHAPLVVGKDLGSNMGHFVVSGSYFLDDVCGFKMGYSTDNHTTLEWNGDGASFALHTKHLGTGYNNSLVVNDGKVGINNAYPSEPLSIGPDLGAYYGDFVQMGRLGSGRYSGFMCGEDEDNRGTVMWYNNTNELRIGYKTGGTDYGAHVTLSDGEMIVTGSGNSSVQLGSSAISAPEILDEPGVGNYSHSNTIDIRSYEWVEVCKRQCNFPTAGYVVALVTCELDLNELNTSTVHLGIFDSLATESPRIYERHRDHAADYLGSSIVPITIHEVFIVDPGPRTFSFRAMGYAPGWVASNDVSLTIMFFPTAYGTVTVPTAAASDEKGHLGSDYTSLSGEDRRTGNIPVDDRIEVLRSEFEAEQNDLKSENAELRRRLDALEAKIGK